MGGGRWAVGGWWWVVGGRWRAVGGGWRPDLLVAEHHEVHVGAVLHGSERALDHRVRPVRRKRVRLQKWRARRAGSDTEMGNRAGLRARDWGAGLRAERPPTGCQFQCPASKPLGFDANWTSSFSAPCLILARFSSAREAGSPFSHPPFSYVACAAPPSTLVIARGQPLTPARSLENRVFGRACLGGHAPDTLRATVYCEGRTRL